MGSPYGLQNKANKLNTRKKIHLYAINSVLFAKKGIL